MGRQIHHIVRGGVDLFRVWNDNIDDYVTEEYEDVDEMGKAMLDFEIEVVKQRFADRFRLDVARARARGTSSRITDRGTDGWDKSMEQQVKEGEFE